MNCKWCFLKEQVKYMKDYNEPFVFTYCDNITEDDNFISVTKAPACVSLRKLLVCNFIPCLTVIYDVDVIGKFEQPNISKRNDLALWLSILQNNKDIRAKCYPVVLARYRVNT